MTEYSETEAQTETEQPAQPVQPAQSEPDAAAQSVPAPGVAPFDGVEVPHTADERVDDVLAGLLNLAGAPVADHVAVYDSVHRGLRDCLADLEHTPNPTNRPAPPSPAQPSGAPTPGGPRPSPSAFGR